MLSPGFHLIYPLTIGYSGGFTLANHKSAEKRARQSVRRNKVNTNRKNRVKTVEKKILSALGLKDFKTAQDLYKTFVSFLDRAAKSSVVSKNHASRKKSRIASRIAQLQK